MDLWAVFFKNQQIAYIIMFDEQRKLWSLLCRSCTPASMFSSLQGHTEGGREGAVNDAHDLELTNYARV